MEEVGGHSLKKLLKSGRARVKDMHLFAEALAKLHLVPGTFGEPYTLDDHLERRCAGLVGTLARAFPEAAADIDAILEAARRQPDEPPALAHGDFHPGQVHVEGKRLWILDLDPLHQGVASYDVAMVIVMLELLGIQRVEERYFRSLGATFLERYFSQIDPARARGIPVQAALILLKRACKRFRWQDEPGWEDTVRRQIRCGAAFASLQQELPRPREIEDVLELYARCPRVA
jgi:aminoglycoside phosphotransferase (APT) family kinase protein